MSHRYWIFKSEPTVFGMEHLACCHNQTTIWDGVRNYQARNFLRDAVRVGDIAFFYHSNARPPGVVGVMTVTKAGLPDQTALDKHSRYYDPRSTKDEIIWYGVQVKLLKRFSHFISLAELKAQSGLRKLLILRPGNRLSITPIRPAESKILFQMAQ